MFVEIINHSTQSREKINSAPFDLDQFKSHISIGSEHGELGYSTTERIGIRPTLDVNGIWGGFTGDVKRNVLQTKAFR